VRWRGLFCAATVALTAVSTAAQAGQTTPPTPSPAPTNTVGNLVLKKTSRLVVVTVIATDSHGKPVTDLAQNDFTIVEDGTPQDIKVFSFERTTGPPSVSPPTPPEQKDTTTALVAPLITNAPRRQVTGPLNVVLLDGINTRLNNQAAVKQEMIKLLDKLPTDRPVAIYLMGSSLRVIQEFTSDPSVLHRVVETLKTGASPYMENAAGGPVHAWYEGMPWPSEAIKERVILFQQETESNLADLRVATTLANFRLLAHALAGYPGRKNVLWVSEAFPLSITGVKYMQSPHAQEANRTYGPELAQVTDVLNDAQISIYPVDARGLAGGGYFGETTQYDSNGDRIGVQTDVGAELNVTTDELTGVHGAMNEIARETGGVAFFNRNDLGQAMREGMDDGSSYYTLAYYPSNKDWDDKYRKISVHVARSGVKLRHRNGYFASDRSITGNQNQQQRDRELEAALSLDDTPATELRFQARVSPPSAATGNKVVLDYLVDAHGLDFQLDMEGNEEASVLCAVHVFTAKVPLVSLQTIAVNNSGRLRPATYEKVLAQGFPCREELQLSPGEYFLRLAVRDNHTGTIGTAAGRLTVPAPLPATH
jgi:VWFA-related protein